MFESKHVNYSLFVTNSFLICFYSRLQTFIYQIAITGSTMLKIRLNLEQLEWQSKMNILKINRKYGL